MTSRHRCCGAETFCAENPSHDLYLGADPTLVTLDLQWSGWPDGTGACIDMSEMNSSNTATHSTTTAGLVTYSWVGTSDPGPPIVCAVMLIQISRVAPFFSVVGCAHGRAQSDICARMVTNLGCAGASWTVTMDYSTTSSSWELCGITRIAGCQSGDPVPAVTSFTKNLNQ